MSKDKLGKKRVCPTTGKKFYDLNKDPVVSPYTGEILNEINIEDLEKEKTEVSTLEAEVNESEVQNTDENIKEVLWKDIIGFQKAMPKLRESGVPNSRGLILAGPPGTGKTMIAKWLAAHSDITCILISAEMITGRNDIKSCFQMARKLSPTLLIIEDIDTAGALDRRASDHPLLGEFLQSMDGIVPNHGVITLATTNHSNKIDPAIADRPGRFDRIVEVGLPGKEQRFHIFHHLLQKLDISRNVTLEVKEKLAKSTEGLTGAWIRAVVQDSLILALMEEKKKIGKEHLFASLKDVMERRGMAYRVAPYAPPQAKAKADVYVQ